MKKNDTHVFANLLYEDPNPKSPSYRLRRLGEGSYVVSGDATTWIARLDNDNRWRVEQSSSLSLPLDTTPSAEPASDLSPLWQQTESARVLSAVTMTVAGRPRYAVGLADGSVRVRSETGDVVADVAIPGRVYALAAIDLDSDGNEDLVAGSDTGGVHAFTPDGKERWFWTPPPWKRPPSARVGSRPYRSVITGIAPADVDGDGKPEILAMGIAWYVLDRQGRALFVHDASYAGQSWDGVVDEFTFLVAPADVTGDSAQEIVGDLAGAGNAGDSNLVHVWNTQSDDPVWVHSRPPNRFAGSALKAVVAADFDADGKDEFAIASDAYNLQLGYYDVGPENRTVWYASLGSGANVMTAADLDRSGRSVLLVGTEMGQLQAIDNEQTRRFITDLKESVTALAVGNVNVIWAGTVNGKLFVLNAEGKITKRGTLPGLINEIVVAEDGTALVTTAGGTASVYDAN